MRTVRFMIVCLIYMSSVIPLFAGDNPSAFRIVGYLPDYRAVEFDPSAHRLLTDLIVFSASLTHRGGLDLTRLKEKLPWNTLTTFKKKERVRLILCVGGDDRSTHFAAMAGSAKNRAKFVQEAVQVCLEARLDGLDLNWEHPKNATEMAGYEKLLVELHEVFEPYGMVLSVTVSGWQKLSSEAIAAVDWVNVMSYDHNGRHATFESARADVKELIEGGVPIHKINLGLPFYGRHITKRKQVETYREIFRNYNTAPEVDEVDKLYFNGPSTIRQKTAWAIQSQLGGVMVWELGQDAAGDNSLLKVIYDTVDRAQKYN
jgi:chitinase